MGSDSLIVKATTMKGVGKGKKIAGSYLGMRQACLTVKTKAKITSHILSGRWEIQAVE